MAIKAMNDNAHNHWALNEFALFSMGKIIQICPVTSQKNL